MKCSRCRRLKEQSEFGSRIVRGIEKLYKCCIACVEAGRVRNSDDATKASRKKWKEANAERNKGVARAFNFRPDVKAAREAYQKSAIGKTAKRQYVHSEHGAATIAAWRASDAGRASEQKRNATKYKRAMADPSKKLSMRIQGKIYKMLHRQRHSSRTLATWSDFSNGEAVRQHFNSLLTGDMTMQNHGTVWHVGHRIARAMYDESNPEDVRRCWNSKNLFPQMASENLKMGVKLPDDATLLMLRSVWPSSWMVEFPDEADKLWLEQIASGRM